MPILKEEPPIQPQAPPPAQGALPGFYACAQEDAASPGSAGAEKKLRGFLQGSLAMHIRFYFGRFPSIMVISPISSTEKALGFVSHQLFISIS